MSKEILEKLDRAAEQFRRYGHMTTCDAFDRMDADDAELDRLRNRVAVLEMVIREELYPSDCNDEANAMIVEGIIERKSPALPSDQHS